MHVHTCAQDGPGHVLRVAGRELSLDGEAVLFPGPREVLVPLWSLPPAHPRYPPSSHLVTLSCPRESQPPPGLRGSLPPTLPRVVSPLPSRGYEAQPSPALVQGSVSWLREAGQAPGTRSKSSQYFSFWLFP